MVDPFVALQTNETHLTVEPPQDDIHDAGGAPICAQQQAANAVALHAAQCRKSWGLYFQF